MELFRSGSESSCNIHSPSCVSETNVLLFAVPASAVSSDNLDGRSSFDESVAAFDDQVLAHPVTPCFPAHK